MYSKMYKYILPFMLILPLLSFVFSGCAGSADKSVVVMIDWVDFIKFNGITYLRTTFQTNSIPAEDLSAYDKIQFKVADVVTDPGYQNKDGDAAYLEIGTPVYSIQGYSPEFRLVALRGQQQIIFEADTNLNAKIGADLLDIGGKVTSIRVNSNVDGTTELASITDAQQVSKLVQMVLEAPIDQTVHQNGAEQYFLDFHLWDSTVVHRSYWLDTGELSRGIFLPEEFGQAIRSILR